LSKSYERGFTLLEIIVALALVAILLTASIPYLQDGLKQSKKDRIIQNVTEIVSKKRLEALSKGRPQQLQLPKDLHLPEGWKLEVKGFSDNQFHDPREQFWRFDEEGMSSPMSLKIQEKKGEDTPIMLSFDPITGEVPDENTSN
jgi:prepilin-type N-terminal cleavage/methylation domain-containing protein